MKKELDNIVIIGSDDLLYKALKEALGSNILLLRDKISIEKYIKSPIKITTLIIEEEQDNIDKLSCFAQFVFSFVDAKIKHQIMLKKPIKLSDFIDEIENTICNKKIFRLLGDYVYCELRSSFIKTNGGIIKLSNIENKVMRAIILSQDFYISKDTLQKDVWKYSIAAETNTIEQNMQKLRNVLPDGFLRVFKDGYKIFVEKSC